MPEAKRPQKGRIFISYRRADSAGYAGRIYDRLVANFGEESIFMDVDAIEGGTDFVKVLEGAVQSCDVLFALIGKQWLDIKDKGGKRRLDNPEDFVRIEIAAALKRNIRVIPVLVDGVDMPQPTELPENLKALARRNALQVNHHSFNPDVYRLIEHTVSALKEAEELRLKAQALQVAREKAESETTEKYVQEEATREQTKKDVEREAQPGAKDQERQKAVSEMAAQEKGKVDLDVWAGREKDEQHAARREAWIKSVPNVSVILKPTFPRTKPVFSVAGIVGMMIIFIWLVTWGFPKLNSLLPVSHANFTQTFHAGTTDVFILPTATSTKTLKPEITLATTRTPVPTATMYSGSLSIELTDKFGAKMVLVPEGKFIMGSEMSDTDERPVHTVALDSFYIDKYEVTNVLYKVCVDAGKCIPPIKTYSSTRSEYYGNPDFDDYPVIFVDWGMADRYCAWRGARLPTEAEWEKSARGVDGRTYPWGENINCSYANYRSENGYCIGDTVAVGSYESGKSLYGIYDLVGNVSEWVSSLYSPYPYDANDGREGTSSMTNTMLRGGAWYDFAGSVRSSNRNPLRGTGPDGGYFGFRCVKDAIP